MRTRTCSTAVALAVFMVAISGCGVSAPPSPGSSTPSSAASSRQAGPYTVSLVGAPNPAVRGINTVEIMVADANGKPVSDAKVTLDMSMTNMNMGKYTVVATSAGSGRYTGSITYSMAGPWRITVSVEQAGQPKASTSFDFSVNQR
jgi:hypothetical protein